MAKPDNYYDFEINAVSLRIPVESVQLSHTLPVNEQVPLRSGTSYATRGHGSSIRMQLEIVSSYAQNDLENFLSLYYSIRSLPYAFIKCEYVRSYIVGLVSSVESGDLDQKGLELYKALVHILGGEQYMVFAVRSMQVANVPGTYDGIRMTLDLEYTITTPFIGSFKFRKYFRYDDSDESRKYFGSVYQSAIEEWKQKKKDLMSRGFLREDFIREKFDTDPRNIAPTLGDSLPYYQMYLEKAIQVAKNTSIRDVDEFNFSLKTDEGVKIPVEISLLLKHTSAITITIHMSFAFTSVQLQSYPFPAHQYLGINSSMVQIGFVTNDEDESNKIAQFAAIQTILQTLDPTLRVTPERKDFAFAFGTETPILYIENEFLKAFGFSAFHIRQIKKGTIKGTYEGEQVIISLIDAHRVNKRRFAPHAIKEQQYEQVSSKLAKRYFKRVFEKYNNSVIIFPIADHYDRTNYVARSYVIDKSSYQALVEDSTITADFEIIYDTDDHAGNYAYRRTKDGIFDIDALSRLLQDGKIGTFSELSKFVKAAEGFHTPEEMIADTMYLFMRRLHRSLLANNTDWLNDTRYVKDYVAKIYHQIFAYYLLKFIIENTGLDIAVKPYVTRNGLNNITIVNRDIYSRISGIAGRNVTGKARDALIQQYRLGVYDAESSLDNDHQLIRELARSSLMLLMAEFGFPVTDEEFIITSTRIDSYMGIDAYGDFILPEHPMYEYIEQREQTQLPRFMKKPVTPDYFLYNNFAFWPKADMMSNRTYAILNIHQSKNMHKTFRSSDTAGDLEDMMQKGMYIVNYEKGQPAQAVREDQGNEDAVDPYININSRFKQDQNKRSVAQLAQKSPFNRIGSDLSNHFPDPSYKEPPLKDRMPGGGIYELTQNFDEYSFYNTSKSDAERLVLKDNPGFRKLLPTYKIYFLKQDNWEVLDDFYDTNGIIEIRYVAMRDNPVQTVFMTLVNPSQSFIVPASIYDSKTLNQTKATKKALSAKNATKHLNKYADEEKYIDFFPLQEGVGVQIRMGYEGDPNRMEVLFNGFVSSMSGGEVINLTLHSYGAELTVDRDPKVKTIENDDGGFFGAESKFFAYDVIKSALNQPHVRHFGRWAYTLSSNAIKGQLSALISAQNRRLLGAIGGDIRDKYRMELTLGERIATGWGFIVSNYDENLFIEPNEDRLSYKITGQNYTTWDFLKSLELMYRGHIIYPLPYESRMTLFFGPPAARYAYREFNAAELASILDKANKKRIEPYSITGFVGLLNRWFAKDQIIIDKTISYTFEDPTGLERDKFDFDHLEKMMTEYIDNTYGNGKSKTFWPHIKSMLLIPDGVGTFKTLPFINILSSLWASRYALSHDKWLPFGGSFVVNLDVNEWKNVNLFDRIYHLKRGDNDVIAIVKSVIDMYMRTYNVVNDHSFTAFLLLLLSALDDAIILTTRVNRVVRTSDPMNRFVDSALKDLGIELGNDNPYDRGVRFAYAVADFLNIPTGSSGLDNVIGENNNAIFVFKDVRLSDLFGQNGLDLGAYEFYMLFKVFLTVATGYKPKLKIKNEDQFYQGMPLQDFVKSYHDTLAKVANAFVFNKHQIVTIYEVVGWINQMIDDIQAAPLLAQHAAPGGLATILSWIRSLGHKVYYYYLGFMVLDSYLAGDDSDFITQFTTISLANSDRYRPFRRYHYISSFTNIITNELTLNEDRIFNAVEITDDDDDKLLLKFNDAIPEWKTKVFKYKSRDAVKDKDKLYAATAILQRHISRAYDGHILVLMNPNIKPYDYLYINDIYRGMVGFVEVDRVVHVFSREGCYTEIKPAMATSFNDVVNPGFFASIALTLQDLTAPFWESYTGRSIKAAATPLKGGEDFSDTGQDLSTEASAAKATAVGMTGMFLYLSWVGSTGLAAAAAISSLSSMLITGLVLGFFLAGRDKHKVQMYVHPVLEHGQPFVNDLTSYHQPTFIGRYASIAIDANRGFASFGASIRRMTSLVGAAVTGDVSSPVARQIVVKILL